MNTNGPRLAEQTLTGLSVSVLAEWLLHRDEDDATFNTIELTSEGDYDIFVAKIDADGEYQWATLVGRIKTLRFIQ